MLIMLIMLFTSKLEDLNLRERRIPPLVSWLGGSIWCNGIWHSGTKPYSEHFWKFLCAYIIAVFNLKNNLKF